MSENVLDCRGLSCPLPVIRVKDQVEQNGGPFTVLVDPGCAVENISRFLTQRGLACTISPGPEGTMIQVMT